MEVANALTVGSFTVVIGTTYTFTVPPTTPNQPTTVNVGSAVAQDNIGNCNTAALPFSTAYALPIATALVVTPINGSTIATPTYSDSAAGGRTGISVPRRY